MLDIMRLEPIKELIKNKPDAINKDKDKSKGSSYIQQRKNEGDTR